MVHHYEEETAATPDDDETKPTFHATIEPPALPEPPALCRQNGFGNPIEKGSDRLLEVLPYVLVSIGVAYTLGVLTGCLMTPPEME